MKFSAIVSTAVAAASICSAHATKLTNFLLVTTSQLDPSANTSELKAVSATSLFVRLLSSSQPIRPNLPNTWITNPVSGPLPPTRPPPPPHRPWLRFPSKLHANIRHALDTRARTLRHQDATLQQHPRDIGLRTAVSGLDAGSRGQYCAGRGVSVDG
jgi:hypothetical protein